MKETLQAAEAEIERVEQLAAGQLAAAARDIEAMQRQYAERIDELSATLSARAGPSAMQQDGSMHDLVELSVEERTEAIQAQLAEMEEEHARARICDADDRAAAIKALQQQSVTALRAAEAAYKAER